MKIGYLFINFLIKGRNFHFSSSVSLRKMCPHSQLFWSAFSHIRTEYKEIRSISPYSCHTLEPIFHQPFYQETDFERLSKTSECTNKISQKLQRTSSNIKKLFIFKIITIKSVFLIYNICDEKRFYHH